MNGDQSNEVCSVTMTDAELAILSLVAEKPSDDCELRDLIEARGLRRWTAIGSSSMYYVLDKLERQGLIRRSTAPEGPNGRRTFHITAAGTGVLQTSVADLLSSARSLDRNFEMGLAHLDVLKSSQVETALLNREQELTAQLSRLREAVAGDDVRGTFHARALFSHRVAILEAELSWLADFITAWRREAPTDPELTLDTAIIPRSRQVVLPQDPDSVHKRPTRKVAPHRRPTPPGQRTRYDLKRSRPRRATGDVPDEG